MTLFEILGSIRVDSKDAISSIDAVEKKADSSSGKMNTSFGKVGGLLKGALVGGALAVGTALVAMGIKGVQGASELEGATDRIQAALGITEGEAKRLGGVAQDVFLNNFGGSVTEAAGMVQTLRQQLGEMSDEQTSKLTQMAATISDVYGADYAQTINTAKTLTDQFGLSNEQAFDFITTGFQKGLDSSGDFLDSINEYGTQFSNGGASADEFFGIMESGLQGGMLGTDKAADAFKEFRLRIQDGSKLTGESLAMLGINADDLAAKISSGQMTAADAFQLVINKLGETTDPMVRMQAGAGLIGSQFEDLGDTAVQQLSMTTTSLEDMAGATDAAAKAAYDNLGASWQTLSRIFQTSATEVMAPLIPVLNDLLGVMIEKSPIVIDAAKNIASYLATWSPQITQLIGAIGPVVTDIFGLMAAAWTNVVKPVWDTIAPYVAGVFSLAAGTIKAFKLILEGDFTGAWVAAIDGLKGFLTGLEGFLDNFFGGLWSLVKPGLIGMRDVILAKGEEIRDGFSAKLTELKTAVFEWSVDLWADIAATMSSFVGKVITVAVDVYNGFTEEITAAKDWTVGVFSRLWGDVKTHIETFTQNVVDSISGIPEGIGNLGKDLVDAIKGQFKKEQPNLEDASASLAEDGVLEPVKETLEVHSPARALYAVGTAVVQGLAGGISDPAEVARVQTAAANLGNRVLTSTLDALGITQPENPYHLAGQAMMQSVLDGLNEKFPQFQTFLQRLKEEARAANEVVLRYIPNGSSEGPNTGTVGWTPPAVDQARDRADARAAEAELGATVTRLKGLLENVGFHLGGVGERVRTFGTNLGNALLDLAPSVAVPFRDAMQPIGEASSYWANTLRANADNEAARRKISLDQEQIARQTATTAYVMENGRLIEVQRTATAAQIQNQLDQAALEADANRIQRDTENAMSVAHLAQMQSGALGAQAWIQATWQNTTSFLSGAVSWVGSTLSGAVSWIGSTVSEAAGHIYQAAVGIGTELIKLAASEVPGLGAAMGAMAGGPIAMLTAFFVDLISSTWQFQSIIEVATRIMQPLINTMGRLIEAIWPLISITFAKLEIAVNAIAWVFDKVLNPAINFVAKTMASVWNAMARTLNRLLGWAGVNIPTIDVNAGPNRGMPGGALDRVKSSRGMPEGVLDRIKSGGLPPGMGKFYQPGLGLKPPKNIDPKDYLPPGYKPPKSPGYKAPKQPGEKGYKPPKGYKAPGAPGRPGSPSYKAPKIGSPGSGSAPGGGSSGSGGTKVSEITGPTRDLFADLLSPLVALPELIGIGNRTFDLLNQRLTGGTFAAVGAPAPANLAPFNLTVNMSATGKLEYDGRKLAQVVTPFLARALETHRRGRGG